MFDITLIKESSQEFKFPILEQSEKSISIQLKKGLILVFENLTEEDDTIIYFKSDSSQWHTHADMFINDEVPDVELVPYEIMKDLCSGDLLVSKHYYKNGVVEVKLEYPDFIGTLSYVDPGEEITFIKI